MTDKGQVTIPRDLREQTGLLPGSEVEFEQREGGVLVKPAAVPVGRRGQRAVGLLRKTSMSGLSTDELLALTRT